MCPDLIYEVVMSDDSAIDSKIFTFDAAAGTLKTKTVDTSKIGTYKMKLTASHGKKYPKVSVNFFFAILSGDSPYVSNANDLPTFKDTQITDLKLDKSFGDVSEIVLGTLSDTKGVSLNVTFSGLESFMTAAYDQTTK